MIQKHMVNNFIHKVGFHCESSSMRDLFEFYGFPMSEAMAFGLDATMGFAYFDGSNRFMSFGDSDVPFFLGGKQGSIEPNSLACRLLGITLRKQSFTSADKAWQESKKLIDQNIPLILRIDMGYLPFFEFEEEFHFGGHAITLAGYDEEKGLVYAGDSEYKGFQAVSIELLKQGRNSTHGSSYLHPKNTQFSMTVRPDGKHPPLGAGVKLAIQQVVNNMLRPSMNNIGIQGLRRFANGILEWNKALKDKSYSKLMFELIYGYIETFGTGGASFRNLYKKFLEELLIHPELKEGPRAWNEDEFKILNESISLISVSAKNWTILAETLKKSADNYKNNCLQHVNLEELNNFALNILTAEEKTFKILSKLKI